MVPVGPCGPIGPPEGPVGPILPVGPVAPVVPPEVRPQLLLKTDAINPQLFAANGKVAVVVLNGLLFTEVICLLI
jgi:hypothetical protein